MLCQLGETGKKIWLNLALWFLIFGFDNILMVRTRCLKKNTLQDSIRIKSKIHIRMDGLNVLLVKIKVRSSA